MNRREKILAAVVLSLVAAWVGSVWYGKYKDTLAARRAAVQDAKTRLADVSLALAEGRSAIQQLERLQERSLPDNRERALSLYKAWLLAKAKDAGLAVDDIKPSARTTTSTAYNTIGYQMESTGSLPAVAAMLYEFYRSPLLHQITRLRFNRAPGEADLQVSLEVEALCLNGATATESLPEGSSDRLKLASLEAYQKSLSDRDLASAHTPRATVAASAPPRPAEAESDYSEQARFSATVPGGKGLQAWINVPATGETLHLSAGDPLKIGKLEGTIVSIEPRSLVLQTGEKKFRIVLGQSLRGGKELDSGTSIETPAPDQPGSPPPG